MVEKISVYPKFFLNKPIQFASDEVPEGIKCVEKSKFSHSVILVFIVFQIYQFTPQFLCAHICFCLSVFRWYLYEIILRPVYVLGREKITPFSGK